MNEIRLKSKNLIIVVGAISFLLIWLLFHNRCVQKDSEANGDALANSNLPTIYAITPTYARPVQKAELTRWKEWKGFIVNEIVYFVMTTFQIVACYHVGA